MCSVFTPTLKNGFRIRESDAYINLCLNSQRIDTATIKYTNIPLRKITNTNNVTNTNETKMLIMILRRFLDKDPSQRNISETQSIKNISF